MGWTGKPRHWGFKYLGYYSLSILQLVLCESSIPSSDKLSLNPESRCRSVDGSSQGEFIDQHRSTPRADYWGAILTQDFSDGFARVHIVSQVTRERFSIKEKRLTQAGEFGIGTGSAPEFAVFRSMESSIIRVLAKPTRASHHRWMNE